MQERRLGKFYASQDIVEDGGIWSVLKELEFVPWHVEFRIHIPDFEYIGFSPLFEICELGQIIPTYIMEINESEDGELKVGVKIIGGNKGQNS